MFPHFQPKTCERRFDNYWNRKKKTSEKIPPLRNVPQRSYAHLGPDAFEKIASCTFEEERAFEIETSQRALRKSFFLYLVFIFHEPLKTFRVHYKTSIDSTQFASLVNNGITNEVRTAMDDWTRRPPSAEFQEEGFPLKFSHMTKFYENVVRILGFLICESGYELFAFC